MAYDELGRTSSFWVIYSPLSVKLVPRYKTSILFKINFGIIYPAPTLNASCKTNFPESFHQKPDEDQKLLYLRN